MIAAFVRDPEQAPDAACIAKDASHVTFLTPATLLVSAGIGKLQFAMLQAKIETFLIPIFCIAFLLSIWTIGPLAWLVRRYQKRSEPQLLARVAPWVVALGSLAAASFFVIVFALVLFASLRNENSINLLLGAPVHGVRSTGCPSSLRCAPSSLLRRWSLGGSAEIGKSGVVFISHARRSGARAGRMVCGERGVIAIFELSGKASLRVESSIWVIERNKSGRYGY